jgi:hypothetical protein
MNPRRAGIGRYSSESARVRAVDARIEAHLKANGKWDFLCLMLILLGALIIGGSIVAILRDGQTHGFEPLEGIAIAIGAGALSAGLVLRYARHRAFERLVRERIAGQSDNR